jgi:flagellin-specific chaperone FliS
MSTNNNQNSKSGRNKGNKNYLTKNAKEILYDVLKLDLERLDKLLNTQSFEERIMHLKHFSKILTTGNDEISYNVKRLIYLGLEEHYKKMKFYFPHIPHSKKIQELRQFLKLLPIHNIEEVIDDMKKQKINFK